MSYEELFLRTLLGMAIFGLPGYVLGQVMYNQRAAGRSTIPIPFVAVVGFLLGVSAVMIAFAGRVEPLAAVAIIALIWGGFCAVIFSLAPEIHKRYLEQKRHEGR